MKGQMSQTKERLEEMGKERKRNRKIRARK
jgi:hypothetical protein